MTLYNKTDRRILKQRLVEEPFRRITVSFYRYVMLGDTAALRDALYRQWEALGCFGRIYIAREGINAQMSVPEHNWEDFVMQLNSDSRFAGMPFRKAVDDDGKSFRKLAVKVKGKIVADGLEDGAFDVTAVGTHLDARAFNEAMEQPDTVVVDMRNHYESEVGHFRGALLPDADTFREALDIIADGLRGREEGRILMYCTGGIRCEKASAFLRHRGFRNVSQLHGGIISYAHQVKQEGLENKFIGKNFVFDDRLGERITDDIIAECHQCGAPCDSHTNCANNDCHLLFIQCPSCADKYNGCCTPECQDITALPEEEQRKRRKKKEKPEGRAGHHSRLRGRLGRG